MLYSLKKSSQLEFFSFLETEVKLFHFAHKNSNSLIFVQKMQRKSKTESINFKCFQTQLFQIRI